MEFAKRAGGALQGRGQGPRRVRSRDKLGEHRVELRRRRKAEVGAGVDPHAGAARFAVSAQGSGAGRHDPRLHGISARLSHGRLVGQSELGEGFAGRDAELSFNQINAGNLLGHRMLYLDPRVALDKEVFPQLWTDQELDCAGVDVAGGGGQPQCIIEDRLPQRRIQAHGRRNLHDLLISQLDRAITLPQVDEVACSVGQHLDFDMAGALDQLLEEDGGVAKGGQSLALAALEGLGHLSR